MEAGGSAALSEAADLLETWKSTEITASSDVAPIGIIAAGKQWPSTSSHLISDCIPQASKSDLGRRVVRKKSHGWAAIGIITAFEPLQEVCVTSKATVEGEICEEMAMMHKKSFSDLWTVTFGNGDEGHYDVNWIVAGLNLFQKISNSADLQKSFSISPSMLEPNAMPPGMRLGEEGTIVQDTNGPSKKRGRPKRGSSKYDTAVGVGSDAAAAATTATGTAETGSSGKPDASSIELEVVEIDVDAIACQVCGSRDNEECMVLCDACCDGYHFECLDPPLEALPEDDWFCRTCTETGVSSLTSAERLERFGAPVKEKRKNRARPPFNGACPRCGKEFISKLGLRYHEKNVCNDEKLNVQKMTALLGDTDGDDDKEGRKKRKRRSSREGGGDDAVGDGDDGDKKPRRRSSSTSAMKRKSAAAGGTASDDDEADNDGAGGNDDGAAGSGDDDDDDNDGGECSDIETTTTTTKKNDGKKVSIRLHGENSLLLVYNRRRERWRSAPIVKFTSTFRPSQFVPDGSMVDSLYSGLWRKGCCTTVASWIASQSQIRSVASASNAVTDSEAKKRVQLHVPGTALLVDDESNPRRPITVTPFTGIAAQRKADAAVRVDSEGEEETEAGSSSVSVSELEIDLYLNAGGPVWGIVFAPLTAAATDDETARKDTSNVDQTVGSSSPKSAAARGGAAALMPASLAGSHPRNDRTVIFERFLAVSTARIGFPQESDGVDTVTGKYGVGHDVPYNLGVKESFPNLLQIWRLSKSLPSAVAADLVSKAASSGAAGTASSSFTSSGSASAAASATPAAIAMNSTPVAAASTEIAVALAETKVELAYCVGLPSRGPVWSCQWSPCLGLWRKSKNSDHCSGSTTPAVEEEGKEEELLGAVACVCGDGSCIVLVLPRSVDTMGGASTTSSSSTHPRTSTAAAAATASPAAHLGNKSKNNNTTTTSNSSNTSSSSSAAFASVAAAVAGDVPVIPEAAVCRWEFRVPGTMIISASWSPHDPLQLVCGLLDGSIAVFKLDLTAATTPVALGASSVGPSSPSASGSSASVIMKVPSVRLVDQLVDAKCGPRSAVRTICVCPYNPQLLMSGGYDGDIKLWNVNDPYKPLQVRRPGKGWVYSTQWDPQGCGIYAGCSDDTSVVYDGLWTADTTKAKKVRPTAYSHRVRFGGIWSLHSFVSDDLSAISSVASDGSMRCAFTAGAIDNSKFVSKLLRASGSVLEAFRIDRVSDTTKKTSSKLSPTTSSSSSSSSSSVADQDIVKGADRQQQWSGPTATLSVSRKFTLSPQTDIVKISVPTVALHAIDSTSTYSDEKALVNSLLRLSNKSSPGPGSASAGSSPSDLPSSTHNTKRIFAYGGAAGLVRIHSFDLREQTIGK